MMESNNFKNASLNSSPCVTLGELLAFSSRKISAPQKHEIEHHLAYCALCSDAIKGISNLPDKDQIRPIIHSLSASVRQRIKNYLEKITIGGSITESQQS